MNTPFLYELLGYLASILVAVSLTMSSLLELRLINLLGAVAFTAYGLLIRAYPVAAVNAFIVVVNLWYLAKILGEKEYFKLLEVRLDEIYVRGFLDFHADEIRRYLPRFSLERAQGALAFFVLRDMVPAGLFVGHVREGGRLWVELDYVIPGYRDFKAGKHVMSDQAAFFRERGVREIVSLPGNEAHERYLRKMGFRGERQVDGSILYCRRIDAEPGAAPSPAADGRAPA